MDSEKKKPKLEFFFLSTAEERDELVEMILDSFYKADKIASALQIDENSFKDLYRKEVIDDVERSMNVGLSLGLKINDKFSLAMCGWDVMDIELSPFQKAYLVPFEPYERIMNSLFSLIKTSTQRGEQFYYQYLVRNPKQKEYNDFRLTLRILTLYASILITKRGYKGGYYIPISSAREMLVNSIDSKLLASINLKNLIFGNEMPFKNLDFELQLVRICFDDNKSLLTKKLEFLENNIISRKISKL